MEPSPESSNFVQLKQVIDNYENRRATSVRYGAIVNIGTALALGTIFGAVIFAWGYFNDTRGALAKVTKAEQLIDGLQNNVDDLQGRVMGLEQGNKPAVLYASVPGTRDKDGVFKAWCNKGDRSVGGTCVALEGSPAIQNLGFETGRPAEAGALAEPDTTGWSCVWNPRINRANVQALCLPARAPEGGVTAAAVALERKKQKLYASSGTARAVSGGQAGTVKNTHCESAPDGWQFIPGTGVGVAKPGNYERAAGGFANLTGARIKEEAVSVTPLQACVTVWALAGDARPGQEQSFEGGFTVLMEPK